MTPDDEEVGTEQQVVADAEKVKTEEVKPVDEEVVEEEGTEEDEGAETDDESTAEEGKSVQEEKKPVSRAQERIRRQAEELKVERAEKEKAIAERAGYAAQLEILRQQQYAAQSDAQRKAEEQRLSLLAPEERAQYESAKKINELEWKLNQLAAQREDDKDRANFHAKAIHDETYGKYAEKVENMYQEGLSRGVRASREDLLAYQLGKELLKNKDSKAVEKKNAASKRIESVTSTPANAKGDVAGTKKGKTEEDRLRGMLI